MKAKPFRRHLSESFLRDLCMSPVRTMLGRHDLDVRLRADEVHVYADGSRLAGIKRLRGVLMLQVNRKYVAGSPVDALSPASTSGNYLRYQIDDAFASIWNEALGTLIATARSVHRNPEGVVEAQVERANRYGPAFYVIDRQVQIPGLSGRLDVLGIAPALNGAGHVLIALEIKNALDNRIQRVGAQVCRYVDTLTSGIGHATGEMIDSYAMALTQLRALGRVVPDSNWVVGEMSVAGAILLANYNVHSKLLSRAQATATPFPVTWVAPQDLDAPLTNPLTWPRLTG
jgi:hypothetical protein